MNRLEQLVARWRVDAQRLEELGQAAAAAMARRFADELDAALRAEGDTALTLAEAVELSGYSDRQLRELITNGTIPNAGRKGAPRIRKADLPRKARRSSTGTVSYDAAADARSIVTRTSGGGR